MANDRKTRPYIVMLSDGQITTLKNILQTEKTRINQTVPGASPQLNSVKNIIKSLDSAIYQSIKWQETEAPDRWKR